MTPAEEICDIANRIGICCNLLHDLVHDHCEKIQKALQKCGYSTEGSFSDIQLQTAAKNLDQYGLQLLWLSKAIEKQRFDLLQASEAHNVVPHGVNDRTWHPVSRKPTNLKGP